MANNAFRVVIPTHPEQKLALAELVLAKHTTDGAASPLNAMSDHNWTANGPKVAQARTLQTDITQMEKDLENLYKQRDLLLAPVMESVKASRDLLYGANRTNPKKLGDWGYVVNDTPQKKKEEPRP